MSKFTPGPWIIASASYLLGDAGKQQIATFDNDDDWEVEQGANRSLVSAAPDMYEALKLVNLELTSAATSGKVRAALAKAEGRS